VSETTPAFLALTRAAGPGGGRRPGGQLLLAFQAGDEKVHLSHAYGHTITLDTYRRTCWPTTCDQGSTICSSG
jgi:hypothetical protein